MADAFVAIFKGLIIGKINSAVNDAIPAVITSEINGILASTGGLVYLTEELAFDITFDSEPLITDTNMALYLNATMFSKTTGYKIPSTDINDIKILTSTANSVEVSVSHFTANSFLLAVHDSNLLEYTLTPEAFPMVAEELTTTYLDGFLPGLVTKYGKDLPVSIGIKANSAPRALF